SGGHSGSGTYGDGSVNYHGSTDNGGSYSGSAAVYHTGGYGGVYYGGGYGAGFHAGAATAAVVTTAPAIVMAPVATFTPVPTVVVAPAPVVVPATTLVVPAYRYPVYPAVAAGVYRRARFR
ncbi:MAG: hypothetical protein WCI38_02570, partial [Chthoniobacterales bacterium]